ncbi:hypothetical protein PMAYCL1PPCAC_20623, partial [Pristionchus mayeri]
PSLSSSARHTQEASQRNEWNDRFLHQGRTARGQEILRARQGLHPSRVSRRRRIPRLSPRSDESRGSAPRGAGEDEDIRQSDQTLCWLRRQGGSHRGSRSGAGEISCSMRKT